MRMKPSELPLGKDVKPDNALRRVSEWKLENSEEQAPVTKGVEFIQERSKAFMGGMRRAFARMEHRKRAI